MIEKMSRKTFIIVIIIFFILLYVGLKLIIVYCQDLFMSNEVYDKEYGIGKVMNIEAYSMDERNETDYFSNRSDAYKMKIKNYFDDFELGDSDSNYEYYMHYNEDSKVDAAIMLGQFDSQLSNIDKFDKDSPYYEFNYFPLYISSFLRGRYLDKYNIKNDVDLIKYIRNRKKNDCTFITPITTIKENYFFNYIETVLPDLDTITYLEGDLEGYMFETDSYKQACVIKDDKLYCITFYKLDYFDDDKIQDILNSLIIEK